MSWETRNGRSYYYQAEKVGGRVVKRYLGSAEVEWVGSAATIDRLSREQRTQDRQAIRQQKADAVREIDAAAAAVSAFCREVQQIAAAAIEAAGYHRHSRGSWRKRRMAAMRKRGQAAATIEARGTDTNAPSDNVEVMKRARDGDSSVLPQLQAVLDGIIEQNGGSLPRNMTIGGKVAKELAEMMTSGGDLLNRTCIVREIEMMAADVAGPSPSPLERLLAERVAICHAHLQMADRLYQASLKSSVAGTVGGILLERQERAQDRYLAAIKTMAQVRKLQLPTVQVALPGSVQIGQMNVGEKQINVTGQSAAPIDVQRAN